MTVSASSLVISTPLQNVSKSSFYDNHLKLIVDTEVLTMSQLLLKMSFCCWWLPTSLKSRTPFPESFVEMLLVCSKYMHCTHYQTCYTNVWTCNITYIDYIQTCRHNNKLHGPHDMVWRMMSTLLSSMFSFCVVVWDCVSSKVAVSPIQILLFSDKSQPVTIRPRGGDSSPDQFNRLSPLKQWWCDIPQYCQAVTPQWAYQHQTSPGCWGEVERHLCVQNWRSIVEVDAEGVAHT